MIKRVLKFHQHLEWLRSLFHPEPPAAAAAPDLFVPDGCLALVIRNELPEAWLEPGRHPLSPDRARLEVRLIPAAFFQGEAPCVPGQALGLPYERALLLVDGRHVATVIPGRPVREQGFARPAKVSSPASFRDLPEPVGASSASEVEVERVYALI